MASESQPTSGADRIRSLKTEDDIFNAFDSYPWTKDKNFMVRPSSHTQSSHGSLFNLFN